MPQASSGAKPGEPRSLPAARTQGVVARAGVITGTAPFISGRGCEGFQGAAPFEHLSVLGAAPPALLFQGKAKKGDERETAAQSGFVEQTGPHPARPPACQSGRKSNNGPCPGSTAPFGGWVPRFLGRLAQGIGSFWSWLGGGGRDGDEDGAGDEDEDGDVHPAACPGMALQPCPAVCPAYSCGSGARQSRDEQRMHHDPTASRSPWGRDPRPLPRKPPRPALSDELEPCKLLPLPFCAGSSVRLDLGLSC